ncbi:MAG: aldo/keto reductase [Hyphomicrobium sp.]|jgi:hypothetical protein
MKAICLPNGRSTTQLGFGCGSLHGALEARQSLRLIDAAFEAGIRHFDVASSYGLGLAEGILGRAIAARGKDSTITTKAGLGRPGFAWPTSAMRTLVKPVLARFTSVDTMRRIAGGNQPLGSFEPALVRASLEESLAALRTRDIDIFLMHEIRGHDVTPALLEMLAGCKLAGVIGAIGTGTCLSEEAVVAAHWPDLAEVRQFRWDIFEPWLKRMTSGLVITHGAIRPALVRLRHILDGNRGLEAAWSSKLDEDLRRPERLADLLLGAALANNRDGLVLVYSKREERIRRFVSIAGDAVTQEKGKVLAELMRSSSRQNGAVP